MHKMSSKNILSTTRKQNIIIDPNYLDEIENDIKEQVEKVFTFWKFWLVYL